MKPRLLILLLMVAAIAAPAYARNHTLATSMAEGWENGPDAQILKAVAKELNLDIVFSPAPFKRRLLMMKNGELDMICGLLKRPEREAYIHFVNPPIKPVPIPFSLCPKGRPKK